MIYSKAINLRRTSIVGQNISSKFYRHHKRKFIRPTLSTAGNLTSYLENAESYRKLFIINMILIFASIICAINQFSLYSATIVADYCKEIASQYKINQSSYLWSISSKLNLTMLIIRVYKLYHLIYFASMSIRHYFCVLSIYFIY